MSSTVVKRNPKTGKYMRDKATRFDNVTTQTMNTLGTADSGLTFLGDSTGQQYFDANGRSSDAKRSPFERAPMRIFPTSKCLFN